MIDTNALAIAARTDERAFSELYQHYIDQIYGFVMKRLGHPENTEEVVSDIFRKVFLHLDQFDPQKASFQTWLYRIATTTVIDQYRVQKRKPQTVDIEEVQQEIEHAGAQIELHFENRELIHHCLSKLPKRHQAILQLKFFDDLPHTEIAAIVGMTPNAVSALIHRSLKKLRIIIEEA
ncbi:MAG TPA: sigma-70 family RNA polymerase sigma factor [Patescibacteria group bacterium]|nr:sigma-70 family RNA polymerase sigma factor [Patescibacteria group bacterium]